MHNSKFALLITIYKTLVKGNKGYISPSVNTLIDLVSTFHKINIKRRRAFQCLRYLEDEGYVSRRKRYVKQDDNSWKQVPSLIAITLKGARKLYSMGVDGASKLIKSILDWLKSPDKRWPSAAAQIQPTPRDGEHFGLLPLGGIFHKLGFSPAGPGV